MISQTATYKCDSFDVSWSFWLISVEDIFEGVASDRIIVAERDVAYGRTLVRAPRWLTREWTPVFELFVEKVAQNLVEHFDWEAEKVWLYVVHEEDILH